jgi:hypothetical protein
MDIIKGKESILKLTALCFTVLIAAAGCKTSEDCDTSSVTYNETVKPIISANCYPCHQAASASGGLILEDYDGVKAIVKNTKLVNAINHNEGYVPMPLDTDKLAQCDIEKIQAWIRSGSYETEPLDDVFIQPFESCQAPVSGDRVPSDDNLVCTNVAISGSTEEGRKFIDYGSCDVVYTQRPYFKRDPFREVNPLDPRQLNPKFMKELRWINSQVRSSACVCCHDASVMDKQAAVWDISAPGIWTDQLSDQGVAILSGKVSSDILGKFTAENNNGFSRDSTGFPTTDVARVQQFFNNELDRRGVTDADIASYDEFGYFLIDIIDQPPDNCTAGEEAFKADGKIYWKTGKARYVYVKEVGSNNPGVPPSNDNPAGVFWRLDVMANYPALSPGIVYGQSPEGTYQVTPADNAVAPALASGKKYHLYVLADILQPICNCIFTAP